MLSFQFRNPLVAQGSPGKNRCSDTHFLSVYCVVASALSSLTGISFYPASRPERWVSLLSSSYSWGNGVTGTVAVTRGVGICSHRTRLESLCPLSSLLDLLDVWACSEVFASRTTSLPKVDFFS